MNFEFKDITYWENLEKKIRTLNSHQYNSGTIFQHKLKGNLIFATVY